MLIVFGGLPGGGKTTIARALAGRISASHLRIDAIEQAMRDALGLGADVGPAGYGVAMAVAAGNLGGGRAVVADCVNPVAATRAAWVAVARRAGVPILQVEVICSDPAEHRRRVEGRASDIPGLVQPDWAAVMARHYEPWAGADLMLDTARLSVGTAVATVERRWAGRGGRAGAPP